MARPNLKDRLTQLASMDDKHLDRLHDKGWRVTIRTNGEIILEPASAPATLQDKRKRAAEQIDQSFG